MNLRKMLVTIAASTVLALLATGCPGNERVKEKEKKTDGGEVGNCLEEPYTTPTPTRAPTREDGQPPELACATTAPVWPQSTSVAMGGCLDVFGLGSRVVSTTLKLAVFDFDQNPSTEAPAYGETDVETTTPDAVACSKGAYYRIDNIPTSKPLLVKVYDSLRTAAMVVVDSYQYGIYLNPNDIIDNGGQYVEFEANVIYAATYQALPTTAGVPIDGMRDPTDGVGRGVIAGEFQDCSEDVLANVMVSGPCFDERTKIIYTEGDDCDQANRSLLASGDCGTYAALNANTGQHLIESFYFDGTGVQKLGSSKIYVFPDSVTIYTSQGLDPVFGNVDAGIADTTTPDVTTSPDTTMPDTMTMEDATTMADVTTPDVVTLEDSAMPEDSATPEDSAMPEDAVSEDI